MARRTRHKLVTDRGRLDVLAYSRESAVAAASAAGYAVQGVVPVVRAHTPAQAAAWRPDWPAIRAAQASLGLSLPVEVKLTGHQGGRRGAYRPAADGRGHRITIKNWLDPEQASRTLWHELTHAAQFECVTGCFGGKVALDLWDREPARRGSYRSRPVEIEARASEARAACEPLAKRR